MSDQFEVSTDKDRFDFNFIHREIASSYWAEKIPAVLLKKAMENSLCFGVFNKKTSEQVGFARVVSDYSTFAYLCDVFITESYRGMGASKLLMSAVMAHPELQGLRRFSLATRDAHGLYKGFGFDAPRKPESIMEITNPGLYAKQK